MAYSETSDIQSEFKNIAFGASNAVSSTEVTEFIAQEEAIINATISNRYEVPVTGAEAVKILKKISIAYVAYRVAKIINLKKDIPIPMKFIPQELTEGTWLKIAKKQLEDIQRGTIVLNDAVARSTTQGIKSYNAENSVLPLWERDTKQW